jgi:hypothetical protein
MQPEAGRELYHTYDLILGKLVAMIHNPKPWLTRANQQWGG